MSATTLFRVTPPSFIVVHGMLEVNMGGHLILSGVGDTVFYKKHGSFSLLWGDVDSGVVAHTTTDGNQIKFFIPQGCRVDASCGVVGEPWLINHNSFSDAVTGRYPSMAKTKCRTWSGFNAGQIVRHSMLGEVWVLQANFLDVPRGYVPVREVRTDKECLVPDYSLGK